MNRLLEIDLECPKYSDDVQAVAAGGDVPALVDAIKIQDSQRRLLERKLEDLRRPAVVFDQALEQRLRDAVGEWREILGRQIPQARQIVTKLLEGRLTFTPESSDGRPGFRFQATGTVEKLVSGVVPECLRAVRPQRDLNPCRQLERLVS